MERERGDLPEDLGRDVPERREAAARAAASAVGRRRRREHRGELVEVVARVVRPRMTPKPTTTLAKGGKADRDEDESASDAGRVLSVLIAAVAALFTV